MGVVSALLKFAGVEFNYETWWTNPLSELLSLAAYLLLISYFIVATRSSLPPTPSNGRGSTSL